MFLPPSWKIHRPKGRQTEQERKARYDKRRGTAAQRGYGAAWRKLRALVMSEEPLCRACLVEGKTTPTQEVDHIVPHRGNDALFFDRANLQGLCKSHHSRKTALHDGGFGKHKG